MRCLVIIWTVVLCFTVRAYAYFENYPPFKFSENAPEHIQAELLVDYDKPDYRAKDSKITAHLNETSDSFDFILKDGDLILASLQERATPFPYAVYRADLDNNGLDDLIVFSSNRGNGLAAHLVVTDLYLKNIDGTYQNINYEGLGTEIEDFVDMNKDGKTEIIIMDMYGGEKHNYFSYSVYDIKNARLVNVDGKFKGFPKFIWFTDKKNDKNTTHLTQNEKAAHIRKVETGFKYQKVDGKN